MGRDLRSNAPAGKAVTRATKSISLVLLGSSLILAGCQRPEDEDQDKQQPTSGGYGGGGHFGHYSGTRHVSIPSFRGGQRGDPVATR